MNFQRNIDYFPLRIFIIIIIMFNITLNNENLLSKNKSITIIILNLIKDLLYIPYNNFLILSHIIIRYIYFIYFYIVIGKNHRTKQITGFYRSAQIKILLIPKEILTTIIIILIIKRVLKHKKITQDS